MEQQQAAAAKVAIQIINVDMQLALRLLEETVVMALRAGNIAYPDIIGFCERELGVTVRIHPSTIELWARRNGFGA